MSINRVCKRCCWRQGSIPLDGLTLPSPSCLVPRCWGYMCAPPHLNYSVLGSKPRSSWVLSEYSIPEPCSHPRKYILLKCSVAKERVELHTFFPCFLLPWQIPKLGNLWRVEMHLAQHSEDGAIQDIFSAFGEPVLQSYSHRGRPTGCAEPGFSSPFFFYKVSIGSHPSFWPHLIPINSFKSTNIWI